MIIIEGADGSGKSTLKAKLKKDFKLIDLSLTKVDSIEERQERALVSPKFSINCITDRSFFISELVYSQLLRGYKVPKTLWPCIARVYAGHLIIICTGQGEEVRKDYDSDEEVWQKTQQTKKDAQVLYQEISEYLHTLTYNFQEDSYEELREKVKSYLKCFYAGIERDLWRPYEGI